MLFLGKDCRHSLALPLKEKGKKLQFDDVSIYFLVILHITKLNKIIKVQGNILSNMGELIFHNKIKQSRFNLTGNCRGGRWSNKSANKVIIVVTCEVTKLSILSGTHSNSSKQ